MSKISIAMTTYNGEKYIIEQLNSLLAQTRLPDEVLIIDDCSTDCTADIIKNFISIHNLKNWEFFVGEENVGYIKNFYNVISKTTGDIIFLCDQDDVWHIDKIELMVNIMENNPSIGVLDAGYRIVNADLIPVNIKKQKNRSNNNMFPFPADENDIVKIEYSALIGSYLSPGCASAITKEIREIYLQNSKCVIAHDLELNIYASVFGKLYFYNKEVIDYRIHNSNTIGLRLDADKPTLRIKGNMDIRKKIQDSYKKHCNLLQSEFIYSRSNKEQKKAANKFRKYLELRDVCFSNLDILSWLKMFFYVSCMKDLKVPRLKCIIGDFVYMLKLESFFERRL